VSEAPELRQRLFKARRLLLAVSVVLLAHYALGIEVRSDAESLGLKFILPDVQKVWVGVWLVWTWALVVYLQHCHEVRFDDFPKDHFQNARYRMVRRLDRKKVWKIAQTKGFQGRDGGVTSLKLERGLTTTVKGESRELHKVTVVWNENDTGNFSHLQSPRGSVTGILSSIWGWIYVMTTTRFGTDYFAPILIAAVTLGYGIRALIRVVSVASV
jgi:hypothetical protein